MMGVGGVGGVPQGSNSDGLMWDGKLVVVPVDGVTPVADELYPWVDEVQVAVELPMGPAGPEGPAPTFGIGSVTNAGPGSNSHVVLGKNDVTGVWEFDFVVPIGPAGPVGPVGSALNVKPGDPLPDSAVLPSVGNVVGDAYKVMNDQGGMDLYVWGCEGTGVDERCSFSKITGWQGPPGVDGQKGLATVSPTAPPEVGREVGEVWFNPSAEGYVPVDLRVDGKVKFGVAGSAAVAGGGVWGYQGDVVFGVASGDYLLEQAKVSAVHGLHATSKVSVNYTTALVWDSNRLMLGSDAAKVHAPTPTGQDAGSVVATKGYADTKLPVDAQGYVVVKDPVADQHPVTLKWWKDKLRVGPVPANGAAPTLPDGVFYFGY